MTIPRNLRGDYVGVGLRGVLISHAKGAVPVAYVAMVFEDTIFIYRDTSSTPLVTLATGAKTNGYMDDPDVRIEVESAGRPAPTDLKDIFSKTCLYLSQLNLHSKWQ